MNIKHVKEMKKQRLTKKQLEQIIGGYFLTDEPKPSDEPIIILARK